MGNNFTVQPRRQESPPKPLLDVKNKCNYNCPTCKQSGKTPNLAGRFYIINEFECKCTGCDGVFPKEKFYIPVIDNATSVPSPRSDVI